MIASPEIQEADILIAGDHDADGKNHEIRASNIEPFKGAENIRILVAEDNLINQELIVALLEQLGGKADLAVNGWEALARSQTSTYDIILMDWQMPELDGCETAIRIRQFEASFLPPGAVSVYIIAMTANAIEGDREKCLAAGMDDFLAKPLGAAALRMGFDRWRSVRGAQVPGSPAGVENPSGADHALGSGEPGRVDWTRLTQMTRDDPDRWRKLLKLILRQTPEYLSDLDAAVGMGSAPDVRRAAHKFYGSSAQAGLLTLADRLRVLEILGDTGDLTQASVVLSEVKDEFEIVRGKLESKLQSFARPSM